MQTDSHKHLRIEP